MLGDGELKPQVIELSKKFGISDNIIFQPFRTDIPAVLSAIDIDTRPQTCVFEIKKGFQQINKLKTK